MINKYDFLPNKHKLDFDFHFNKSQNLENAQRIKDISKESEFFTVFFVPSRRIEGENPVPLTHKTICFYLEIMDNFKKTEKFFTKTDQELEGYLTEPDISYEYLLMLAEKDYPSFLKEYSNKITPKLMIEVIMELSHVKGYDDLSIVYYNNITDTFVQALYIEDFYDYRLYDILDFYMYEIRNFCYYNEDLFDKKIALVDFYESDIDSKIHLENRELKSLVHRLKLTCLEGSFTKSSLDTEVLEMHNDIVNALSKYVPEVTDMTSLFALIELGGFLRTLEVVDIYIKDDKKYIPLDKFILSKKSLDKQDFRLVFHNRLITLLDDKFK